MRILVIEDDSDTRLAVTKLLTRAGHEVDCAQNGAEGLERFEQNLPDIILTDVRMPGVDGLEVLRRVKQVERSSVAVVMITGHGDEETAIAALRLGAFDYFRKPFDFRELLIAIDRIGEHLSLQRQVEQYKQRFDSLTAEAIRSADEKVAHLRRAFLRQAGLGQVVIQSDTMRRVFDLAGRFHRRPDVPVLIEGETGTGKELVARWLHFGGRETTAPFVPVNCGEHSEQLFAAELFGYEAGAFTGAAPGGKRGKFDAASGGTLFLDEIGNLPLTLQTKMLRALQEREFYRVGGLVKITVDVRFVFATNARLEQEVAVGHFREDLFHRISVGRITIPPLRERNEDILPMAYRFLAAACGAEDGKGPTISGAAERLLLEHGWPGNVRQLKNTIERAVIMYQPKTLLPEHLAFLPLEPTTAGPFVLGRDPHTLPEAGFDLEAFYLDVVRAALERHSGNQTKAAAYLGITRKALRSRLRKLEIN